MASKGKTSTTSKTDEAKPTGQAGDVTDALTTPAEHAKTTDKLDDATQTVNELPDADEVAARSADMSEPADDDGFVKTFVLGPSPDGYNRGNPYTEARGFDHNGNKAQVRQQAINSGLWPTGDVDFVSGKRHPDGASWILTYKVPVTPAHEAVEGAQHPQVVSPDNAEADEAENYKPVDEVEQTLEGVSTDPQDDRPEGQLGFDPNAEAADQPSK